MKCSLTYATTSFPTVLGIALEVLVERLLQAMRCPAVKPTEQNRAYWDEPHMCLTIAGDLHKKSPKHGPRGNTFA